MKEKNQNVMGVQKGQKVQPEKQDKGQAEKGNQKLPHQTQIQRDQAEKLKNKR